MNLIHIAIGITVLGCNAVAGVGALWPDRTERFWGWATAGHSVLALQVVTGFLIAGSGSEGPGSAHFLVPIAAFVIVLMVRGSQGQEHPRWVLWASWAPVAAAVFAMVTGFSS